MRGADFVASTWPGISPSMPIVFPGGRVYMAPPSSSASGGPQGPGATLPVGAVLLPQIHAITPQAVPVASSPSPQAVLPAAQPVLPVASAPAQAPALAGSGLSNWLDGRTLIPSFTNGQVVGGAAVLLGVAYLFKRR